MSDAGRVADRYITRGGAVPNRSYDEVAGDILGLANFILWHDPGHIMGGVRREEAFEALCRLLNLEQHVIRKIVLDD